MNRKILNQLESLPFFSIGAVSTYEKIKPEALYQNLQRWVRSGLIRRLKNGLYVTKVYVDRSLHDQRFIELLANKLLMPSYLSLEYVLQKNNLLTEAALTFTSVSLKTTRHYKNDLGSFVYHHINKRLYFGFEQHLFGKNIIYEAKPAKALFDFLYLRLARLDPEDLSTLGEMRINWSEMAQTVFGELCETIIKSGIVKMQKMLPLLKEAYHGDSHR